MLERKLTAKGVTFQVAIDPEYRDLIHGDSKFVVNSRLDVKVGLDGVQVLGASASEWVNGGIRVIPGEKGKMQSSYPLYANLEKAQENSLSEVPTTTLSLSAETLPDVQAGSVVLYRKFAVGEIIAVKPRKDAFDIDLHIKPEYRYLLTNNSVFWAEGGAKVKLDGNGLTVQASPLARAIKGAISFDNLNGSSAGARLNNKRILYASETAARAVGGQITPARVRRREDGGRDADSLSRHRHRSNPVAGANHRQKRSAGESGALSGIRRHLRPRRDPLLGDHSANLRRGRGTSRHPVPRPTSTLSPAAARRDAILRSEDTTISDSRYIDGLNIVVEAPEAGRLASVRRSCSADWKSGRLPDCRWGRCLTG